MKIKKTFQGELPENRIVNTYSDSLTDAYSANYLNDKLRNVEVSSTEPTNGKDIWVQIGKNLFNKNSCLISGKYLASDGSLGDDTTLFYQETYIPVEPNTSYVISNANNENHRICEYDANKTFLTRFLNDNSSLSCIFTSGPSTKFIRVSCRIDNIDSLQIEQGEFKTDYEPYIPKKIYVKKDNKYELVYDEANTRKEVYVGPTEPLSGERVWIQKSKNLFSTKHINKYINTKRTGGVITQILADSSTSIKWKFQTYLGEKYLDTLSIVNQNSPGIITFTFIKTSDFDRLCFGVNGSQKDTTIFFDATSLTNGNVYTLSFEITNATQGSISWQNIQVEAGRVATHYTPHIPKKIMVNSGNSYDIFSDEENIEIYQSGEQRIGTWIDGKPLYRQVLYSSQRVEAGSGYMPNTSIPNINIVTDVDVTVGSFGYASFKNHWSNDGGDLKISTQFDKDSGLYISADYTGFIGWVLKVEYTKTTD